MALVGAGNFSPGAGDLTTTCGGQFLVPANANGVRDPKLDCAGASILWRRRKLAGDKGARLAMELPVYDLIVMGAELLGFPSM